MGTGEKAVGFSYQILSKGLIRVLFTGNLIYGGYNGWLIV
jgi:hypothetical protein